MKTVLFFTFLICVICNPVFAQEAKYELKSAIIEKETSAMGQVMRSTNYFDDYGKKESIYTTIELPEMLGGNQETMSIIEGSLITTVMLKEKTATQVTMPNVPINFLNLTPEIIQLYNLKEVGEEVLMDRPCTIYTITQDMGGISMDSKVWIWKGIQLRTEVTSGGMAAFTEMATSIQENPEIPADKFIVPAGVTGL